MQFENISHVAPSVKPSDYTDTGNGKIYAREYKGEVMFTTSNGFFVWDGKRWEADKIKAQGKAIKLTDRMLAEARAEVKAAGDAMTAAKVADDKDAIKAAKTLEDKAKAYYGHAKSSRAQARTLAMLEMAKPFIQVKPDQLDADYYILNTPTGMVYLPTGELLPHDPLKYCTKITKCGPGNKGSKLWRENLETITNFDDDMEDFLQEVGGMSTVGKVFEENLIEALGKGNNGKSALFNSEAEVLGDYAGHIAAETLTTANKGKGAEFATLKGKRLVIAAETEEGARLSTSALKQITSTDPIHCERKYFDPEDFIPSHTTILYTNHAPKVSSSDNGTWRRLVVVPFTAKIESETEIKNYGSVLAEEAGEAIMSWLIAGAKKFISNGHKLNMPDFVTKAVKEYKNENDWMGDFLEEFCDLGSAYTVGARDLYSAYHSWAIEGHGFAHRLDEFGKELVSRGHTKKTENTGAKWFGLKLKPEVVDGTKYSGYQKYAR